MKRNRTRARAGFVFANEIVHRTGGSCDSLTQGVSVKGLSKVLVLSSLFLAGCGPGLVVSDVAAGRMAIRADGLQIEEDRASALLTDQSGEENDSSNGINNAVQNDDDIRAAMLSVLSRFPTRGELEYLRTRRDQLGSAEALHVELTTSTEALRNYRALSCRFFNSCNQQSLTEDFASRLANGASLVKLHQQVEVEMVKAIEALYRQHLGRRADFEGLSYYLNQGRNGRTLSDIGRSMSQSDEAQLRGFYLQILRREPDAGGFRYWLDRRAAGVSLSDIRSSIQASAEARGQAPASASVVAAQNIVRDEFLGVTGRFPTVSEVTQYTGLSASTLRTRLLSTIDGQAQMKAILARHFGGDLTADRNAVTNRILLGMSRAEVELELRRERQEIIGASYALHLNRAADLAGLEYYLKLAEGGMSRAQIDSSIQNSVEARLRGLYRELLLREPDLMGLLYYLEKIEEGASIESIRQSIRSSDEFRSL